MFRKEYNLQSKIVEELSSNLIPYMHDDGHKGSNGRLGVIGGSECSNGAPYFAAITGLKLGVDIVYNFCCSSAAIPIKCYSPDLNVIPILDSENAIKEFNYYLPKIKSLIIGPGLGNDEKLRPIILAVIKKARELNIPLIIDAEGIYYIHDNPHIIKNYTKAILTPNSSEFVAFYRKLFPLHADYSSNHCVNFLSCHLGGVTVIKKGFKDVISDGSVLITCSEPGSNRRCGGQGDILAGSLSCFAFWAHSYYCPQDRPNPSVLAAFAACRFTRKCNFLAFSRLGRSATTSDMIQEISNAFSSLFPEKIRR